MWNNQNPDDKNLESISQEFSLENIRSANVLTTAPSASDLKEGERRLVYTGGILYEYIKYGDNLYRNPLTAV